MNATKSPWAVMIGTYPGCPTIYFPEQLVVSSLNARMRAVGVDPLQGQHGTIDSLTLPDSGKARALSSALAQAGITHFAHFLVGGVPVLQAIVFNDYGLAMRVLCWPSGEAVTADAFSRLYLGKKVPCVQDKLDIIFNAGGYAAIDLALLGFVNPMADRILVGTIPDFMRPTVLTEPR